MNRILVHLDASPRSAVRLALARHIGAAQGAAVHVVYGVLPTVLASPWLAGEAMAAAARLFDDADREQRDRARELFKQAPADMPMTWIDAGAEPGPLLPALLGHALLADLLVLGQTDPDDHRTGGLPVDLLPSLIIDSGKPALVLPYVGNFDVVGQRVLLAWKPVRESARALTAALPWLRRAAQVHVVSAAAASTVGIDDLRSWLVEHGVKTPLHASTLDDEAPGELLLSRAADVDADLLVMGCYGHSRMREWVLGGATQTVLQSMTLPVLMAH